MLPPEEPDTFWPYAREFPDWEVWRGVDQMLYAKLAGPAPAVIVRGEDAEDLRDQIRGAILRALL
jgi:hypothetical protein